MDYWGEFNAALINTTTIPVQVQPGDTITGNIFGRIWEAQPKEINNVWETIYEKEGFRSKGFSHTLNSKTIFSMQVIKLYYVFYQR
jgi:dUTPase